MDRRSGNWVRHLTCNSMYCIYCWSSGQRHRIGGPSILGERVTLNQFGRRRYRTALRGRLLRHLAAEHPNVKV